MAKGGDKVLQDGELDELIYDDLVEMLNDADDFSCLSDKSSCDESFIVENKLLKEVICLINDLRKYYGQRAQFNHCWANQKFTMNKESFEYIPKKGKTTFVQTNTIFVKASGISFCENCKNIGHNEKNCTNKKAISFDSRYVLFKNSKGCVSAGIPINGAKKMPFGCLKL